MQYLVGFRYRFMPYRVLLYIKGKVTSDGTLAYLTVALNMFRLNSKKFRSFLKIEKML